MSFRVTWIGSFTMLLVIPVVVLYYIIPKYSSPVQIPKKLLTHVLVEDQVKIYYFFGFLKKIWNRNGKSILEIHFIILYIMFFICTFPFLIVIFLDDFNLLLLLKET